MSAIRVLKFGGAALRDGPAVAKACEVIGAFGGERPIVVVSAVEGVTEELVRCAAGAGDPASLRIRHRTILRQLGLGSELLDRHLSELAHVLELVRGGGCATGPTRDLLLSFGERMSARIVSAALREAGRLATPVDAYDLGLVIEAANGRARLVGGAARAVERALREIPGLPVVTGFLASDARGNLTTLGRNGSDLTALLLAGAVGAQEVQLWKAVAGIQTADPRRVRAARTLPAVGYAEALELAQHGAAVLHPEAARLAQAARLCVRLLDVRDPRGTCSELVDETPFAGPLALVHRSNLLVARIESRDALLWTLNELEEQGTWLDLRGGVARIALPDGSASRALLAEVGAEVEDGVASIALVGRGVGSDEALAPRTSELAHAAGIALRGGGAGIRSSSQAWLLAEHDLDRALELLHAEVLLPAVTHAAELAAH